MKNCKPPFKMFQSIWALLEKFVDVLWRLGSFIQVPLPLLLLFEFYILRLATTEEGVAVASAAAPAAPPIEALTMTAYFSGVLRWMKCYLEFPSCRAAVADNDGLFCIHVELFCAASQAPPARGHTRVTQFFSSNETIVLLCIMVAGKTIPTQLARNKKHCGLNWFN